MLNYQAVRKTIQEVCDLSPAYVTEATRVLMKDEKLVSAQFLIEYLEATENRIEKALDALKRQQWLQVEYADQTDFILWMQQSYINSHPIMALSEIATQSGFDSLQEAVKLYEESKVKETENGLKESTSQ